MARRSLEGNLEGYGNRKIEEGPYGYEGRIYEDVSLNDEELFSSLGTEDDINLKDEEALETNTIANTLTENQELLEELYRLRREYEQELGMYEAISGIEIQGSYDSYDFYEFEVSPSIEKLKEIEEKVNIIRVERIKAQEEANRINEEMASIEIEEQSISKVEQKAQKKVEEQARGESEERAKQEAANQARGEAEQKTKIEAEENVKKEVESEQRRIKQEQIERTRLETDLKVSIAEFKEIRFTDSEVAFSAKELSTQIEFCRTNRDRINPKFGDLIEKYDELLAQMNTSLKKTHIFEASTKKIKLPESMTVGIEIETNDNVASIRDVDAVKKKFGKNFSGTYQMDPPNFEISSSVFSGDKTKEINGIYMICENLKSIGHEVDGHCGGHIHIGANYLQTIPAVQNLVELYANTEKILFLISNAPGDLFREGAVGGYERLEDSNYGAASPISKSLFQNLGRIIKKIPEGNVEKYREDLFDLTLRQDYSRQTHYNSLNLYTTKPTVEFRTSNGTLNPDTWIENINLFGGLVRAAQELTEIQQKPIEQRTKDEQEKILSMIKINDETSTEQERLEALLQLTITSEDRDIYRTRYTENNVLLQQNLGLKKHLESQISNYPIRLNPENYRESIMLQGTSLTEAKKRVKQLVYTSGYIEYLNNSLEKDVINSTYPNIKEFAEVYYELNRIDAVDSLFEELADGEVNFDTLLKRGQYILEQKRIEQEKAKQENNKEYTEEIGKEKEKTEKCEQEVSYIEPISEERNIRENENQTEKTKINEEIIEKGKQFIKEELSKEEEKGESEEFLVKIPETIIPKHMQANWSMRSIEEMEVNENLRRKDDNDYRASLGMDNNIKWKNRFKDWFAKSQRIPCQERNKIQKDIINTVKNNNKNQTMEIE